MTADPRVEAVAVALFESNYGLVPEGTALRMAEAAVAALDAMPDADERRGLWACPNCAFAFDRCHTDEPGGGYSCPVCDEAKALADLGTEPPSGSIVASDGGPPWARGNDGGWRDDGWRYSSSTWAEVWTSDLRILRWGWGS